MWRSKFQWMLIALLAASLTGAVFGTTGNNNTAVPGTVNYVEGQVALNGTTLNSKSVGSASLEAGQSITTQTGKTEFLLTPGVYVRLADNSEATLVSPSLTNTQVSVDKGEAMVEVDQLYKQNDIRVVENDVPTQLIKNGLYDFNSTNNTVRVFDGKAVVAANDRNVTVKGGHELQLDSNAKLKPQKFNKDAAEQSDLYRWSSLRSDYLAQANIDAAHLYFANGWYGPGWIGAGWYWDPWLFGYTFLPADGFLYSPFGWGFYAPLVVYNSPYWYGGYYGVYGRRGAVSRPPIRNGAPSMVRSNPRLQPGAPAHGFHAGGIPTGSFHGGASHGGMSGFHGGGGFHGGMGGFHSGVSGGMARR